MLKGPPSCCHARSPVPHAHALIVHVGTLELACTRHLPCFSHRRTRQARRSLWHASSASHASATTAARYADCACVLLACTCACVREKACDDDLLCMTWLQHMFGGDWGLAARPGMLNTSNHCVRLRITYAFVYNICAYIAVNGPVPPLAPSCTCRWSHRTRPL